MPDDATFAPTFALVVNGTELKYGITQFVERVEYESCDGIADAARILCTNPDFMLSNAKVFQPGNEVDIYMGYRPSVKHIGRVIIKRVRPNWPQNAMPTMRIVGYTKDSKMMDNAPQKSKKESGKGGRQYKEQKYSEAVMQKAEDPIYGFSPDIDPSPEAPTTFIHKAGMTDYDFVRGLANLTGYYFWVDWDEGDGKWKLHFRDPATVDKLQDTKYNFKYNLGDLSSLLSFAPEILLQDSSTKIQAQVKNPENGRILKAEFEEESNKAPDTEVQGDPEAELNADHTTASDVKLFLGEFSIEVVANRTFKTEAELILWAQQWFRRQRENFVLAQGRTIGTETLRARQTHAIEGVSSGLDGDYFFNKVKHIVSKGDGYVCDFWARKVVP